MNMKLVKKFLTVTLAATLAVMPITAAATTQAPAAAESTSSTTTTPAPFADVKNSSSVDGVGASQIAGAYALVTIKGLAVRANNAAISAAGANLAAGETAFVKGYEINEKNSPLVFASFKGAAAGVGGVVVCALNIDFGKMAGGKFAALPAGVVVPVTIGLPANAPLNKNFAVVKVLPGGATEILADQDTVPATVTFNMSSGLAAYAVIAF